MSAVGVGVGLGGVCAQYLPPVLKSCECVTTPDDHFTAGPHCCVTVTFSGRIGDARGSPTVGNGVVSAAGDWYWARRCRWGRGRLARRRSYSTRIQLSISLGVSRVAEGHPPHTIISLPVQTAV